MASSTIKPVPIVSAMRERLSRENPASHMIEKVAIIDSGRLTPAIIVARQLRRKRKTTITTRIAAITNVICTSKIDARIVSVRSLTISSAIPAGRFARNFGSSDLISSTVLIIFAPGWRSTSRTIDCSPLYQPPTRAFSNPSTTRATSRTMTGALLRQTTTMFSYCLASSI